MNKIRIATRESLLAMVQTNIVKDKLQALYPELEVEIVSMTTEGDQKLDSSLAKIGGKGLFIKELEKALLEDRADIAVHSMKDMPAELPEGLRIVSILEREDPRDAFVSNNFKKLKDLPQGAVIGTSSLRRQTQLQAVRPDLEIKLLRGNVQTRLRKLDEGQYDAILLAVAGLNRLGLEERIAEKLSLDVFIPAVGQAAIGIECRIKDKETKKLLRRLSDKETETCVMAERVVSQVLGASCSTPLGVFTETTEEGLQMKAFLADAETGHFVKVRQDATLDKATELGEQVAKQLQESFK
jgi:hydroxymethylbilane synthase